MSLPSNQALYVHEDGHFSVRHDLYHEENATEELVIETLYSGVNPADTKHSQHLGIVSTVIGYDFCGRVISAPSGSKFSNGSIVAGYTPSGIGRPTKYGTHQNRFLCPEDLLFEVPSNLPESHAAALTVAAMTAADAVFNLFKFPLPTKPADFSRPVLVWGASSSVGICTVQFLRSSGCQNILVTASQARHELLRSLGATHCFDYSSPSVVSDIATAVNDIGKGLISHAFDAIGTISIPSSSDLMAQSANNSTAVHASVVLRPHGGFQMPLAYTKDEWLIHPPGPPQPIRIPAKPESHWNAWKALQWAIENYGTNFKLPYVEIFEGNAEEVLQEIVKVGCMKTNIGKLVIRHPWK